MKKKKLLKENKRLKKENKLFRKDLETLSNECLELQLDLSYYKELEDELLQGGEDVDGGILSIEDIVWDGDETTVVWCDGTTTTVKKAEGDAYDRANALAHAIAKKVLVGGLKSTVDYYSETSKANRAKKEAARKVYRCLGCRDKQKKKCAEQKWSKVPRHLKQSIRATRTSCDA